MVMMQIEIDDATLADAMLLAGTTSKDETVNLALRQLIRTRRFAAPGYLADVTAGQDLPRIEG